MTRRSPSSRQRSSSQRPKLHPRRRHPTPNRRAAERCSDARCHSGALVTTEGRIDVTLELEAGGCARVIVASSRPLHVWRALEGRSVETCAKLEALRQIAQDLQQQPTPARPGRDSGRGFGTAATSRGPVLHTVEIEQRQVVGWRVVAPTEWTFHPEGPVREALVGLAAPDVQEATRWAQWAVATLDPCVKFGVRARES